MPSISLRTRIQQFVNRHFQQISQELQHNLYLCLVYSNVAVFANKISLTLIIICTLCIQSMIMETMTYHHEKLTCIAYLYNHGYHALLAEWQE